MNKFVSIAFIVGIGGLTLFAINKNKSNDNTDGGSSTTTTINKTIPSGVLAPAPNNTYNFESPAQQDFTNSQPSYSNIADVPLKKSNRIVSSSGGHSSKSFYRTPSKDTTQNDNTLTENFLINSKSFKKASAIKQSDILPKAPVSVFNPAPSINQRLTKKLNLGGFYNGF